MDIRLQHHLAQEFYRQQMFQRISGKFPSVKLFNQFHLDDWCNFSFVSDRRDPLKLMLLMKLMDFYVFKHFASDGV